MRRTHAQRGLSLVELLLGLAITAVLMVPLAATFQNASGSAVAANATVDLDADARFALDRIAQRAAALPPTSAGALIPDDGVSASAWLAPLGYAMVKGDLVETGTTPAPGSAARSIVVASNIRALRFSTPDVGDGQPLLRIDLTLTADGSSVSASRTVRVGAPF